MKRPELKFSNYQEPITLVRYVNPDGSLGGYVNPNSYPPPDHWVLHEDTVERLVALYIDSIKETPSTYNYCNHANFNVAVMSFRQRMASAMSQGLYEACMRSLNLDEQHDCSIRSSYNQQAIKPMYIITNLA